MGAADLLRDKGMDWELLQSQIDERGFAVMPGVITSKSCEEIAALYSCDDLFRSRIDMSRPRLWSRGVQILQTPLTTGNSTDSRDPLSSPGTTRK